MATVGTPLDQLKCTSLTHALKHYFDPIKSSDLIAFAKSCTDQEKDEFRSWFISNGYPNVVKSEKKS